MIIRYHKPVLAAGFALAMALTLSCSGDGGNEPPPPPPPACEDWTEAVTIVPTCGSKGLKTLTCTSDPSDTKTEEIDKVPYDNSVLLCDARDGNLYKFVTIGTGATAQTWFAENLNYNASGSKCYAEGVDGVSADSIAKNCATYGRLYDWATAMNNSASSTANPSGVQGVCPAGWHLPSDAEWNVLLKFVNPSCTDNAKCDGAGTKLKANSALWSTNTGTDDYGFAALPGGKYTMSGGFSHINDWLNWWSTREIDNSIAYSLYVGSGYEIVFWANNGNKDYLFSVRCVKDD